MGARRRALTPEARRAAGERAASHLAAALELRDCLRVVAYAALPDELPAGPLVAAARRAGRPVLWPRLVRGGGLEFAPAGEEELRPGRYGVAAPAPGIPPVPLVAGDLVLVPGVAFDAQGRRLGRGGGHYDRALAAAPPGVVTLGVGYEFQRVEAVPVGPTDVPVDALLSEEGILCVGAP